MSSKDEILQTFQAMTGLDDIGLCMSVLEQCNWSLESAVNNFMPQDEIVPSNSPPPSQSSIITNTKSSGINTTNDGAGPSLLASADLIRLNVKYGATKHTIQLPLTSTLKELQEKLQELTGIECSNQNIVGLPAAITEETQFYDKKYDHLKSSSLLVLQPIVESIPDHPITLNPSLHPDPSLHPAPDPVPTTIPIQAQDNGHKGNDSPDSEPMEDINYDRNQSLCSEQDNEESLADDNNDEFDDELFCDAEKYESSAPLIPEGCEDPEVALQSFSLCFTSRYGDLHPLFFTGSLSDAVKEATGVPVDQRKPLFIYLHHDQSVLSNIFCSQLLCADSIVTYLTQHYVVWAWDLTRENLKRKLLDMVKESFGVSVATHVDDIQPDHLPVILIVYKSKGQIDVRDIIQGLIDPDQLLTTLISAHEQHEQLADDDRKDERERQARGEMIKAQEQAFQDSLQADKEKERQRLQEEEYRLQVELEEQIVRERKEEERQQMLSSIPPEPDQSCSEKVTSIRMRFPDGSVDQRKFLASSHTVRMLLNYVGSKGYPPSDYKMLTSYPKRNITELDEDQTLLEARLYPTETLHIEDDS